MNVLVIGSGGREHAIVEALKRSPKATKIYAAPGNAGIAELAECVAIKDTEVEKLVEFAKSHNVELTVVGPEAALAVGVVDRFREEGLKIFGPTKAAAEIEASKDFAKRLMVKYDVPTAAYATFTDFEEAMAYVRKGSLPTVLKYDGLAAGKGVVIAETMEEAEATLRDMLLDTKFGEGRVVIEEFLTGEEFSLMCFVAGNKICPMPVAQDHKRAYDNDEGPNTGGMGAYTELPFITAEDHAYAMQNIMQRVADAMVEEGVPFTGVLYGGLMKTPNGIKVIEFNARFGDPETEVVLPRLQSDAVDVFMAVANNEQPTTEWSKEATLGIVLASKGYPGSYDKGFAIRGTERVDAKIFHMGTARKDGELVTAGGRVMIVVASAPSLEEALTKARKEIANIECDNLFHRTDIGAKAFR
ncbi:MAG: phosphoribosylamine--glycine ligase [Alistipes sp.]|mgnify:FL=1|nr:phosphoribosylamine--glycine ligase [Alistipes sp.]MBQ2959108.1 phosphoribosylamine--glycine ligase [Alistipes sp.]